MKVMHFDEGTPMSEDLLNKADGCSSIFIGDVEHYPLTVPWDKRSHWSTLRDGHGGTWYVVRPFENART